MDLSTSYLGFKLPHPFMPGASPLVDDLDTVKRLEDAGAAAIVMHSLFEEQITREEMATFLHTEPHGESFAEALSFFPNPDRFALGPDEYLDQIRRIKGTVRVPVIASLNGTSLGGWLSYSRLMEQAGADALELNVYALATDPETSGQALERRTVEMLRAVKAAVRIPVAVKLSPFYSSLAHFAGSLDEAGADGLVLFNRFYQPDLDIEELQVSRELRLSHPSELPLRLRWLAVLSARLRQSFAVSGGVHTATDALKAVMAGADAVQMVSALLQRGPEYLRTIREETARWLEEHEYESLEQSRGSLNLAACPDPAVYERANYMLILQSWGRPGSADTPILTR
jgi:dihydroorotate dehydrogenase (fumarate)